MNSNEKVLDAVSLFGRFVKVKLTSARGEAAVTPSLEDTFGSLMTNRLDDNRSQLYFVQELDTTAARKDYKLQNDITNMMKTRGFGFLQRSTAEEDGKQIVMELRKCIWYILPHLQKIHSRQGSFPKFFEFLLTDSKTLEQDYNRPEKSRHRAERLEGTKLNSTIQCLYKVLMEPALSNPRFDTLKQGIKELSKWLEGYYQNMETTRESMNKRHHSLDPQRKRSDTNTNHIPSKLFVHERYKTLETCLSEHKDYEPVNLSDFLPNDYQKRYYYLADLAMPFPITSVRFPSGGQQHDMHFVWKRSDDSVNTDLEDKLKDEIKTKLPVYHTRAMRKAFQDTVKLLSTDLRSPAAATVLYQQLTGDQSLMQNPKSKALQDRLRLLIDTQDVELATDLRAMNGAKPAFEDFWEEARKMINEKEMEAVNDRRLGTVTYKAIAISVRDFKEQVMSRLPEGTKAPCDQLVYWAFEPKNRFARSAEHFTPKLPCKFAVQKRQLNADHIDGQYAATIYRFLKEFAIMHKPYVNLVFVDDKALVPLGEPGTPLASTSRSKSAVVHDGIPLVAADHDTNTKCKVTPSTALICDIPETSSESFCIGQVYSTLKDTITQPSTPLRHAAELNQILKDDKKEVLVL